MAKTPNDVLIAESLDENVRGTILVAGSDVTEEALRRAASYQAQGVITGGLEPHLSAVSEELGLCVIVTEGFGRIAMSAPIFELLASLNGQDAAANGMIRTRGGNIRPEIFVPLVGGRLSEADVPKRATPLTVQPGATVRVCREPYLGRIGTLPPELIMTWTSGESGVQLPCVEIEFQNARGGAEERALIPWTNLELIG